MGIDPKEALGIDLPKSSFVISDDDTVDYFKDAFRIADDMRSPMERVWDICWDLYNGTYDFSKKEDWQSQIAIPKVRGIVDKAASSFRRTLTRLSSFYQIESETKLGIEKGYYTKSLMDYHLQQADFAREFSVGLKVGLITSTMVYKTWWDWHTCQEPRFVEKMRKEPVFEMGIRVGDRLVPFQELTREPYVTARMGFKTVDPYDFWIGPRKSYKIERTKVDLAYLFQMAGEGVYDREAVEKIASRSNQKLDEQKEAQRKGERQATESSYIREVELYHYWGPLYDRDGKLITNNATFTVADKDVLIRKAVDNPFFHGQDPYVVGTPYIKPFSTYDRGIVEDVAGLAHMITELSNLIVDGAKFDAIPMIEVDVDLLDDSRQGKSGAVPGKAWMTKAYDNPNGKSVIRPVSAGRIPQLAMQTLSQLDRELQLASIVNALRGQDVGSSTLGEYQGLVGSASEGLDDAARTVEETALDPLLDKFAKTIYQYHDDYTLPRLTENFPQTSIMLLDMTPEERYATMVAGYQFRARGVSIMLDHGQDLQKIMQFLQMVGNLPGVLNYLNMPDLVEQIIVAMGWNPQRLLLQQASPSVIPAAVQAGQPVPANGAPPPPQAGPAPAQGQRMLTPNQISAGEQGARLGGANNNPMSNPNARR